MTCCRTSGFWLAGSIAMGCLLPLSVPAESQRATEGQQATAHLKFKIVIPQVLSLDIAESLTIGGNDRRLALLPVGANAAHHLILSASGHRSIAQFADCSRAGPGQDAAMNCTVSMP